MKNDSVGFCSQHACSELLLLIRKTSKLSPCSSQPKLYWTEPEPSGNTIFYFQYCTLQYMELNREGMSHVAGHASECLHKADRVPGKVCLEGNGAEKASEVNWLHIWEICYWQNTSAWFLLSDFPVPKSLKQLPYHSQKDSWRCLEQKVGSITPFE